MPGSAIRSVIVLFGLSCVGASPQTCLSTSFETTVCDIAANPAQYLGKTVRVRAQVWPDPFSDRAWIYGSSSCKPRKTPCRFLAAELLMKSQFGVDNYRATLTGLVITDDRELRRLDRVMLIVDTQSDLVGDFQSFRELYRVPIAFDDQTNTFVRPDPSLASPRAPRWSVLREVGLAH